MLSSFFYLAAQEFVFLILCVLYILMGQAMLQRRRAKERMDELKKDVSRIEQIMNDGTVSRSEQIVSDGNEYAATTHSLDGFPRAAKVAQSMDMPIASLRQNYSTRSLKPSKTTTMLFAVTTVLSYLSYHFSSSEKPSVPPFFHL